MYKKYLASAALASLLFLLAGVHGEVYGAGSYTPGSTGYDVSFTQCGGNYPAAPFAFGVVGVTHGHAYTYNACLSGEFGWATAGTAAVPSLYMNINYAIGSTSSNGNTGPMGKCKKNDKACQAYNYGYNAAADAFGYATGQGATAQNWWLDVETANSWSVNTSLNDQVLKGALDFFAAKGITAGVYSTPGQWNTIAGSTWKPGAPNWVATAESSASGASSHCGTDAFGGGSVWLVQYAGGGFDADYAC